MVGELQLSSNNFTIVKGDSKFSASSATKAYANQIQTDPALVGTFQALQNAGINLVGGSGARMLMPTNLPLLLIGTHPK